VAEIRITIAEIIDLCIANEIIPENISNIELQGEHIKFSYSSDKALATKIDIELSFKEYRNGMFFLKVHTNWIIDKFLRFKKFEDIRYIQYEHPVLTFFLQQFVIDALKIVHIESISFKNGYFKIKTFNE